MSFTDAALHLTQFGFKVFALMPGQKIPAISKKDGGRGCLDATDDENIIAAWGERFPRANIGLACGVPSGVLVIDLDPRNGSKESIERLAKRKQTFPPTVTAQTANGGTHLYFAYEPMLKNSKSALAPGIDVKTTGGYVVAPPSVLEGNRRYSWLVSPLGDCFPRLPRWVSEALKPKPQPVVVFNRDAAPKDIAPLANFVAQSGSGERNKSLFWAACRAAESGVLDGNGMQALTAAGISSGLEKEEVLKTIQSARKKSRIA
jgi:hypothetical protein